VLFVLVVVLGVVLGEHCSDDDDDDDNDDDDDDDDVDIDDCGVDDGKCVIK